MGEIQIGNHSAQEINRNLMHDKISWADHADIITTTSIQEWITRDTARTPSEIDAALNMAHCSFIHEIPQKMQTPINQLSYNERQKLKLAQMILQQPILFIFDDITLETNHQTTLEIWNTIQMLSKDKRVIYAAQYIPKELQFLDQYILQKSKLKKTSQ
jgi:ABC-type multidrug transport system fused ATPase/permease subunit